MIAYLRTSAAGFDIRLKKYLQVCGSSNTPYLVISWNRLMNAECLPNEYSFQHAAPYGYGHRLNNFLLLLAWYLFAIKKLIQYRKRYTIIHACNLETMPIAFLFKSLFGKKVIFDIYDTSEKYRLERYFIRCSDLFILPSEKRLEQEGFINNAWSNFLVVENVPIFTKVPTKHNGMQDVNKIVLSYVGTFQRQIRGLENMLRLVLDDERFILELAGSGDGLEKDFEEASNTCSRIHFHGTVNYNKALEIMHSSDFIIAQYYLCAPVHKYASPNKFYESLFLGVPIITTKDTLVGYQTEDCDSGYVIGDGYEDLKNLFSNVDDTFIEAYHIKEENAKKKWNADYKDYFNNHMINQYIRKCHLLSSL